VVTIEARGVSKSFGEGSVLIDVDLEIESGETTVLLGPNGSGKTILLSCLAGGLHPDEGAIRIDGEPPADRRDRLSFLQQDALAIPNLSARECAQFYADLHPRANGAWTDLLDRFELEERDRRLRDCSGGMRRKLELAVTLAPEVPIYLLDEPTTELDMTAVDTFRSAIRERAEEGAAVVLASHLPGDARAADRLVFVVDGRIVADGTPAELLAAVPDVVRFSGAGGPGQAARDHLVGGRAFERGEVVVGFLASDSQIEDVEAAMEIGGGSAVELDDPTYADLFNYHAHVA